MNQLRCFLKFWSPWKWKSPQKQLDLSPFIIKHWRAWEWEMADSHNFSLHFNHIGQRKESVYPLPFNKYILTPLRCYYLFLKLCVNYFSISKNVVPTLFGERGKRHVVSQIMWLLRPELGRCACATCNKQVHFASTCDEALLQYVTGLSLRLQVAWQVQPLDGKSNC